MPDITCAFPYNQKYPYILFFVQNSLTTAKDVQRVSSIIKIASKAGYTGMVLSARLDQMDLISTAQKNNLVKINRLCQNYNIDLIPCIFSAGYGASILAHNPNLAAGIPVKNIKFKIKNNIAQPIPVSSLVNNNGGFEQYNSNIAENFLFHDKPGKISFIDKTIFHKGAASLRLENFSMHKNGNARVCQEISVKPFSTYNLSCWIKSEGLQPFSKFKIQIYTMDGKYLTSISPLKKADSNWKKISLAFNSMQYSSLRFYIGIWEGFSGKFWLDDIEVREQPGLCNILRRPGTPILVISSKNGRVYKEGRDFEPVVDKKLNYKLDHPGPVIKFKPSAKIKNKEQIQVSYYQGVSMNHDQTAICMSEPEVYQIWNEQIRLLDTLLTPGFYFLSMDEIRQGGACQACKKQNLSMAEILGNCITRQHHIIKNINPRAKIFIWSDMLDPNHNARNNYDMVTGDFSGSWRYIPKDIIIVCWYYQKREQSLRHFTENGFKILAAAYYDKNSLETTRQWLKTIKNHNNSVGIMYTTWKSQYNLLTDFGHLANE